MSQLSESQKAYVEERVAEAAVDVEINILQGHSECGEDAPDQQTLGAMIIANQVLFYTRAYQHWECRMRRCIAQGASKDKSLDEAVVNMRMSTYARIFCVTRKLPKEPAAIIPNPKKGKKVTYACDRKGISSSPSWLTRD